MQEKKLSKDELEAMAERLSKPRPPPPPQKRVRAVKLVYTREKGSKKFVQKLVPAKKVRPLLGSCSSACTRHHASVHGGYPCMQK